MIFVCKFLGDFVYLYHLKSSSDLYVKEETLEQDLKLLLCFNPHWYVVYEEVDSTWITRIDSVVAKLRYLCEKITKKIGPMQLGHFGQV